MKNQLTQMPISENRKTIDSRFFDKLVTKVQLAEQLGLSLSYIAKLMSNEGLPFYKLGRAVRFSQVEVVDWLQKRRRP